MYPYCFPEKVQSLNTLEVPTKESPYKKMSTSSSKNLKVLQNISTDFFVGTEVSGNNRLLMEMLIQDIQKTEQLNERVFTNVWTCMFSSGVN